LPLFPLLSSLPPHPPEEVSQLEEFIGRVTDPNNLRLEFTVDHPEVERINTDQLAHAHESLQRWLSGHHTPNNDFRLQ
jgi:hypothetical protein